MKRVYNKLGILAAGIVAGFGVIQTEAQAASFNQIIDIDARLNSNNNPISLMLSAGIYSVDYIGKNDGGAYDAWNAWGSVFGCDSNGENCSIGWLSRYSISSNNFNQTLAGNSRYDTALMAMQNALDTSFTVASDSTVNFFIPDSVYGDNEGGVSLRLSSQSIPEPASILGLLSVGAIGISIFKGKKQAV